MANAFEEHFKETGLNNSYRSIMLDAWNAAVEKAAEKVDHNSDGWDITWPEEIMELHIEK